jgi:hypothetical protein
VASASIPISVRDKICSDPCFCNSVSVGKGVSVLWDKIQVPRPSWAVSPGYQYGNW